MSLALAAGLLHAETLRIATWNVELARDGPGLLLRDLRRGNDPQIAAILEVLRQVSPDTILLQSVDYDLENHAARALAEAAGYANVFAFRPNTGRPSGLDLDGDGQLAEPEDGWGYGAFSGQGGMAILSRHPILSEAATDHSDFLWQNLPRALLPRPNNNWPSAEIHAGIPLASVAAWEVPLAIGERTLTLWAFHASPPVFDGTEDRNGKRNHDEIRFWLERLDGAFGPVPEHVILLGQTNQDPLDGEGRKAAIRSLLADPRLQDAEPRGTQGLDTVDWTDVDAGKMRVSYILTDRSFEILDTGVYWPEEKDQNAGSVRNASRHRLVWMDLRVRP